MDLQFHIHKQSLQRIDHEKVVANTNRYHFIVAKFTDDWGSCEIDCIGYSKKGEPIEFNVDDTRENVWVVPPGIIQSPAFNVSFVGVKPDGTRITTPIARVNVEDSGYVSGTMPEDTYPTKYEAMMARLAKLKEESEAMIDDTGADTAHTYSSRYIEDNFIGKDDITYSSAADVDKLSF